MTSGMEEQLLRQQLAVVMQCHRQAVSLDPNNGQCWMNQGAFLLRIHLRAEAIESFEKAQALGHPKAATALAMTRQARN